MNPAGGSDNELLQLSLAGDREAFGRMVERYQCLVCTVSYSLTGDLALSEDVAQETFLAAWQGLRGLKDLGRFKAWLCGIARNLARNASRRRRQGVSGRAVPLEAGAEPAAVAPEPVQQLVSSEEQQVVWQALEQIPEGYREPLVLYYREAQSVPRVAEALELSEDAVKQRLARGRIMLKEQVAAFVEETLAKTRPGKALTVAVLAALPAAVPEAAAAGVLSAKGSAAVKTATAVGMSGALLGSVMGVLGAAFGVMMSIVHARSGRERRFVLALTVVLTVYVGLFFGALYGTVRYAHSIMPSSSWLFGAVLASEVCLYGAGLVATIAWANLRLRRIREEEGTWNEYRDDPVGGPMSRFNFAGALVGSVFGSLGWLLGFAWYSGDWLALAGLLVAATCVCVVSTLARERWPDRIRRIVVIDIAAVFALSLLVVLFRWDAWFGGYASVGGQSVRSERIVLPNGIRVIVLSVPGSKNVSIFTYTPLGMVIDGPGQGQWSHLIEHLIVRSTAPEDYAHFNAETLPDHMRLDTYGDIKNWREALSHHARWLGGEPLREEHLEREKAKASAECDLTAQKLATHKFAIAAWAQVHRHGRPQVALRGDLAKAHLAELEEHRKKHLAVRDQIVVCVVGGVTKKQVETEAVRQLGGISCAASMPAKVREHGGKHNVAWDLDARHLVLTWPIPEAPNADLAALVVAENLLTMRMANDAELAPLVGMALAGADLTTPEGRFFYVSASLRPTASVEGVQKLLEGHVAALASGNMGQWDAAMVAKSLAQQCQAPLDPAVIAAGAGPGVSRAMMEGNIGVFWGTLEFRFGPARSAMAQWMAQVDREAVRRAAARHLKLGAGVESLALSKRPAD